MIDSLVSGIVICALAAVGLSMLHKLGVMTFTIDGNRNGRRIEMKNALLKIATMILVLLGCAFLAGALLAFLQGVSSQVVVLAVTGVICLVLAIFCGMVYGRQRKRIE